MTRPARYLWITRWADFQHYAPERDRPPAWIKDYTKQLDDERYLRLTTHQRAVLHDLRSAFARAHGRLSTDTRQLSRRLGARVTTAQLETLNHAGFIEFISRPTLEQRLDELYNSSSPRARPRAREEEVLRTSKRGRRRVKPRSGDGGPSEKDPAAARAEALAEAEQVATGWNGGDSDEFATALDEIANRHRTAISDSVRARLWEVAFQL